MCFFGIMYIFGLNVIGRSIKTGFYRHLTLQNNGYFFIITYTLLSAHIQLILLTKIYFLSLTNRKKYVLILV